MEMRELRLISAYLRQRLDTQEEEGEKLEATMEEMQRGVGLDFLILINTPAFEEIHLYLLQLGSKQTLEKVMAKNANLDLSYLDDEDESMEDAEARLRQLKRRTGSRRS